MLTHSQTSQIARKDPGGCVSGLRVRTPGNPGSLHTARPARVRVRTPAPLQRVRVRTPGCIQRCVPGVLTHSQTSQGACKDPGFARGPYTHAAAAAQPLTWSVRFKPGSRARCGKANRNSSGFFPDSRKYCETQHILLTCNQSTVS